MRQHNNSCTRCINGHHCERPQRYKRNLDQGRIVTSRSCDSYKNQTFCSVILPIVNYRDTLINVMNLLFHDACWYLLFNAYYFCALGYMIVMTM